MKSELRRMLAMALVAAFALIPVSVTSADDAAKPEILIEEMRHDLGEVYEQEKYTHKFKVKNVGTADLMIEKVKPG